MTLCEHQYIHTNLDSVGQPLHMASLSLSCLFVVLFCFDLIFFETGSHVCQADLQLTMQLRMTRILESCFQLWVLG